MDDPYATLGIAPGADASEIRRAYRRAALACHPDRSPGDPGAAARFRAVHRAYVALTASPEGGGPGPAFEPMAAPRIVTVRVPLAHAVRGAVLELAGPSGGRVVVPPTCGEGVVLRADGGAHARVAHLIPPRFRREGGDLVLTVEVASSGPLAGHVRALGAADEPLQMALGADFPRRVRLEGAGAPLAGRTGRRADLVLVLSPVGAPADPAAGDRVRRPGVDVRV